VSEKYKVLLHDKPNFLTLTVVGWVDLFIRPVYTQILDESFRYCMKSKGLIIHAYVYMTSHLHLIVSSQKEDINATIRDFKKHTSKKLIEAIIEHPESRREWLLNKFAYEAKRVKRNTKYKLWRDGFHPVLLDTYKKWEQRVNYIHYNPVDAQFVYHERDWRNSSYAAYEEGNLEQTNIEVTPLW
jgi:REP element-mobilizing transposase RayT